MRRRSVSTVFFRHQAGRAGAFLIEICVSGRGVTAITDRTQGLGFTQVTNQAVPHTHPSPRGSVLDRRPENHPLRAHFCLGIIARLKNH